MAEQNQEVPLQKEGVLNPRQVAPALKPSPPLAPTSAENQLPLPVKAEAESKSDTGQLTLEKARSAYDHYSGKASEITRQLGFAAIALVWVFRIIEPSGNQRLSGELIQAGELAVLGLALDYLHYIAATVIWGAYSRYKEWQGALLNDALKPPSYINWLPLGLFWGKIIAMLFAYKWILVYLNKHIL